MSMNFTPMALKDLNGRQVWSSVFPSSWTSPYIYGDGFIYDPETDMDDYGNPDYRPQYDLNLSNSNACSIMNILGFKADEYDYHIEINEFIAVARQWLIKNFGKLSEEIKAVQEGNVVYGGKTEGYFNTRIHAMVVLAKEGKEMGATHVSLG